MNKERYLSLRNRYKPLQIKIVFIAESPPISGKYFYDESGLITEPLFAAMMKLLQLKPRSKRDGLKYFSDTGHFLIDATYEPVNHLKGKARENAILQCYDELIHDLDSIDNSDGIKVILIKANICRLMEDRLTSMGFNVLNNGVIVPFPSTGHQKVFRRNIKRIYKFIPNQSINDR